MSVAVARDARAAPARTARAGNPRAVLVLGGARSGKSAFAEAETAAAGLKNVYVATAEAGDAGMAERIRRHRERRGPGWIVVEEPLALAETLRAEARADRAVLVDCLTLWLSNLLTAGRDPEAEGAALAAALAAAPGPVVTVSSEVGQGIIPDNPLARRFRDEAGALHQRVAEAAGRVVFVAAGLPLTLKDGR